MTDDGVKAAESRPMEIIVFVQGEAGKRKIEGIGKYGRGMRVTRVVEIAPFLPEFIDEPEEFIDADFAADLVLDYLTHPDLAEYLVRLCNQKGIPVISSGKKIEGATTPFTCCGLVRDEKFGEYGRLFGLPEYEVQVEDGLITAVRVLRGAPCGATAEAIDTFIGCTVAEALTKLPREVQYRCVADPSGFDPVTGKSPVHFAGHVHRAALKRALSRHADPDDIT